MIYFDRPTPKCKYSRRARRQARIDFQRTVLDCAREIRNTERRIPWNKDGIARANRNVRGEQTRYNEVRR